jgi:hypothetical protein
MGPFFVVAGYGSGQSVAVPTPAGADPHRRRPERHMHRFSRRMRSDDVAEMLGHAVSPRVAVAVAEAILGNRAGMRG